MESLTKASENDFDDNPRRVNSAVFISKERDSSEDSETEDSDLRSIISSFSSATLLAPDEHYNSDSSTSTIVGKILPKRKQYDPEAYQKWLSAKMEADRNRKEKEEKVKKRQEMKKKLEEEKRKQLSEEKLKLWMERKDQERLKKTTKAQADAQSRETQLKKKWIPTEASETTFRAWKDRIEQKEEARKRRQVAALRKEEKLRRQRQYLSNIVYEDWLKTSSDKPKPVPLNQGVASLRGSISKIYVNPVPWKSNIE